MASSSSSSLRGNNAGLFLPAWSVKEGDEQREQVCDFLWDTDQECGFLGSPWNEHERAPAWYRSPWSAKYFRGPHSFREGRLVSVAENEERPRERVDELLGHMRSTEQEFNDLFSKYVDYYYGKDAAVSTVILWAPHQQQNFSSSTSTSAGTATSTTRMGAGGATTGFNPHHAPAASGDQRNMKLKNSFFLSASVLDPEEDAVLEGVFLVKKLETHPEKDLVHRSAEDVPPSLQDGGRGVERKNISSSSSSQVDVENVVQHENKSVEWNAIHRIRLSELSAKKLLHAATQTTSVFRVWTCVILTHSTKQEKAGQVVQRTREEKHRKGKRVEIFGRMVENIENEIRNTLESVYLPKHQDLLLQELNCMGPNLQQQKSQLRSELQAKLVQDMMIVEQDDEKEDFQL
ncbi:unnamed protein product [Amoebophrya sp. A120]|nr:unnamed protein product [Amoebophrya sp. A120]|eukprot:GSA120T00018710001.1